MRKIISEGPFFWVEREGPEEFCNFKGSFAEWVIATLEADADRPVDEGVADQAHPVSQGKAA